LAETAFNEERKAGLKLYKFFLQQVENLLIRNAEIEGSKHNDISHL
jgi:hypothetical protein